MFEALLLIALPLAHEPRAETRPPVKPSLELLEFLGEFGDDEAGWFEDDPAPAPDARRPAGEAARTGTKAPSKAPPRKSSPSSPPAPPAAKEPA